MPVTFFAESVAKPKLTENKINNWLNAVAQNEGQTIGEVNIIFVSDNELLEINRQYLNHDYYTDVITFDYSEKDFISGDIFISIDRVKENAEEYNEPFEKELNRVMVHGVLHLLGYQDKTPEQQKEMRAKEDYYLLKLE